MQQFAASLSREFPWWTDRGPLPEVREDDSDLAWREFDEWTEVLELRLHAGCKLGRGAAAGRRPSPALAIDDVMHVARINDRVCPVPGVWQRIHAMLCSLSSAQRAGAPPPPINLLEWTRTSDFQKQLRLREQVAWARRHGAIAALDSFLRCLPERDWHHNEVDGWPGLPLD